MFVRLTSIGDERNRSRHQVASSGQTIRRHRAERAETATRPHEHFYPRSRLLSERTCRQWAACCRRPHAAASWQPPPASQTTNRQPRSSSSTDRWWTARRRPPSTHQLTTWSTAVTATSSSLTPSSLTSNCRSGSDWRVSWTDCSSGWRCLLSSPLALYCHACSCHNINYSSCLMFYAFIAKFRISQ